MKNNSIIIMRGNLTLTRNIFKNSPRNRFVPKLSNNAMIKTLIIAFLWAHIQLSEITVVSNLDNQKAFQSDP